MDLAGLASLLGIPIAVAAAIWVPRDRALMARLERIEKQLADGTTAGQARQMLENARDHVAERVAIAELRPRYRRLWLTGLVPGALGVALLILLNISAIEQPVHRPVFLVIAWICYFGGVVGVSVTLGKQQAWLSLNRSHAYSRRDEPFI